MHSRAGQLIGLFKQSDPENFENYVDITGNLEGPDGEVPAYGTPQNVPLPGGKTPKRSGPFKVKGKDAKFKVDWTTPGHTGLMVPVTAAGPAAERFSGVHPNTFVHEVASDVLNGNP